MIVIFDWDGTLCDSLDHIVRAMQAAAVERGMATPSADAVRNIVGLGLPEAVQQLFPELPRAENAELAATYSRQYVSSDQPPATLFEGAMHTLQTLRERGFELAVATGKSRRGLNRVLDGLNMGDFFDASRCADETRSKPHPTMLMEIMGERSKAAHQALMVGDTEYDLEMAALAGMASVGVSFGVHSAERLARHRPLAVVDMLADLLDLECLQP